jgi:AcrR family transcriptional regulator
VKVSTVSDARHSEIRERILQTASDLFYLEGLNSVGVNRIIEEADVAKATFYRHFPSKELLVLAYLDEMDRLWGGSAEGGCGIGSQAVGRASYGHV